jgi:DNA-binding MurR/RpiR family transcriptional regulator
VNKVHKILADYIHTHPEQTFREIATVFKVSSTTISKVAKAFGLSRAAGGLSEAKALLFVERANIENNATPHN